MDKEVLIHVRGLQTMDADGEQEPLEIVVPGQYYFRNGSHYLRYEEVMEEFCRTYRQLHKNFPEGNGGPQERCGQCSYGFLNRVRRI